MKLTKKIFDEIVHSNYLKMDLAIQKIAIDKTVRSETVQVLKYFNTNFLTTQARKREQLNFMMPAIKKTFNLMGDDIVQLHTENESLKNKLISYDEK